MIEVQEILSEFDPSKTEFLTDYKLAVVRNSHSHYCIREKAVGTHYMYTKKDECFIMTKDFELVTKTKCKSSQDSEYGESMFEGTYSNNRFVITRIYYLEGCSANGLSAFMVFGRLKCAVPKIENVKLSIANIYPIREMFRFLQNNKVYSIHFCTDMGYQMDFRLSPPLC